MKRVYLFYSLVLLFPPVHELGHTIIANLIGEKIVRYEWTAIYLGNVTRLDFLHTVWEYTVIIPLFCTVVWGLLVNSEFKHGVLHGLRGEMI
jgi:hypothetical protein